MRPLGDPAIRPLAYRPFFIAGSAYAGALVLGWTAARFGAISEWSAYPAGALHAHELLFGFVPAIVAGYTLTAAVRWTRRLPIARGILIVLLAIWALGRLAVLGSRLLGPTLAGAIDVAFLPALAATLTIELTAARAWRRLPIVAIILVVASANALFHVEAAQSRAPDIASRAGLAGIVLLISVVGGRIVPRYTRRWLERQPSGRAPAAFGGYDVVALIVAAVALARWAGEPSGTVSAVLLAIAGALHAVRLARWAGERTAGNLLVLALHLAYAFVPAGLALAAAAALEAAPADAATHAWSTGAIGAMTVAVMSRTALRHSGWPLLPTRATSLVFTLVFVGALLRTTAAFGGAAQSAMLAAAGVAWSGGFLGLAIWLAALPQRR